MIQIYKVINTMTAPLYIGILMCLSETKQRMYIDYAYSNNIVSIMFKKGISTSEN